MDQLNIINRRINDEFCKDVIDKLSDISLLDDYRECKSVKNEIDKLSKILDKNEIEQKKKESIINDYLLELIPAGTKGVIRGNKFNHIVKDTIEKMNLDKDLFEVCFEKQCQISLTTEIPDWYILEKKSNRVIIGMNQLDLWGGGQQINRGSKYLLNNKNNTSNSKLLCVICNHIQIKTNKNKAYTLFEEGFKNNTLTYISNLEKIIKNYFIN
jgi:hypothetical protein